MAALKGIRRTMKEFEGSLNAEDTDLPTKDASVSAILRRALETVRGQLRRGTVGPVEVAFRPDTTLGSLADCSDRFERAFGSEAFDLSLVCVRKEDPSVDPFALGREDWEGLHKRLLMTPPSPREGEWIYDMRLRKGERGLAVPGRVMNLENYLYGEEFAHLLAARLSKRATVGKVLVSLKGDYLSAAQAKISYDGRPREEALAREVDARKQWGVDPALSRAIVKGDFKVIWPEGLPLEEALQKIRKVQGDSSRGLVVNGDPHVPLPETIGAFTRGFLYGWRRMPDAEQFPKEARLLCKLAQERGADLAEVKSVLVYPT